MEGEVKLWGIVGVCFDGTFNGSLQPGGLFKGTWDGIETGNQLDWDVDASGDGTWTADEAS